MEKITAEKEWQNQIRIRTNQMKAFKEQYSKLMRTLLNPEKYK